MTHPPLDAGRILRLALVLAVAGCASQPPAPKPEIGEFQRQQARQATVDKLNALISSQSASDEPASESYVVGPGDLLKIEVFGVPDLAREVRVDGEGDITLPLIDEIHVGGKTVRAVEELVAARYSEDYLRDPQINVLVEEYRARRITVLGAVKEPRIYSVERKLRVLEALAMAGGLDADAGRTVYVTDHVADSDTGQPVRRTLLISLDELLNGSSGPDGARGGSRLNVVLGEGAVVNVPRAGVVYVEGAVNKPGVYRLQGDMSVLKAVAVAGGLKYEAKGSSIKVLHPETGRGRAPEDTVNIDRARTHPDQDVALNDGDVVVVETSGIKAGLKGFYDGVRGIVGFGFSLNPLFF